MPWFEAAKAAAYVVVATSLAACEDAKPSRGAVSASSASLTPSASPAASAASPSASATVAVRVPEAPIRIENVGFASPESVLYDSQADVYLVSNIHGDPLAADDNGFISRVSPAGKVLDLKWIDGRKEGITLHAPRGMALTGAELFVADRTTVRAFHRRTGAPGEVFEIPGATALDDVAPGPNGSVYITDTGRSAGGGKPATDAIHYGHESLSPLITGATLGSPHGVLYHETGALFVNDAGELCRVDGGGQKTGCIKLPKGGLEGMVRLEDMRTLLVSSREAGAIYQGTVEGPFKLLWDGLEKPADLGYDHRRRRVLIPLIDDDAVLIRALP